MTCIGKTHNLEGNSRENKLLRLSTTWHRLGDNTWRVVDKVNRSATTWHMIHVWHDNTRGQHANGHGR